MCVLRFLRNLTIVNMAVLTLVSFNSTANAADDTPLGSGIKSSEASPEDPNEKERAILGNLVTSHRSLIVEPVLKRLFGSSEGESESERMISTNLDDEQILRTVFSNIKSKDIKQHELQELAKNASTLDDGVPQLLSLWGFSQGVINQLMKIVKIDPSEMDPDFAYEIFMLPEESPGVTPFIVTKANSLEEDSSKIFTANYNNRILFQLKRVHSLLDSAYEAAYFNINDSQKMIYEVTNRQLLTVVNFLPRVERLLFHSQALLSFVQEEIWKNQNSTNSTKETIEDELNSALWHLNNRIEGITLGLISQILEMDVPQIGEKTYWKKLSKSINLYLELFVEEEKMVFMNSTKIFLKLDRITENISGNKNYTTDGIPKLILDLQIHKELFKNHLLEWDSASGDRRRKHSQAWYMEALKAPLQDPYFAVNPFWGSDISKFIENIDLPPIENELAIIKILVHFSILLTEQKLNESQIDLIQQKLTVLQTANPLLKLSHLNEIGKPLSYDEQGDRIDGKSVRKVEVISEKTIIVASWIEDLFDSSQRHMAHEKYDFSGMKFELPLTEEETIQQNELHQNQLAKLRNLRRDLPLSTLQKQKMVNPTPEELKQIHDKILADLLRADENFDMEKLANVFKASTKFFLNSCVRALQ